ncbi:MAG: hypothetical protein IPG32_02635 [Saprospirales bacterium]|nr:hypothetical protein [Saprospirales bacterium]
MRRLLNIAIFALISFSATAQIEIKYDKGTVSFISSQNVYVKFGTTEAIKSGDTLYVARDGKMVPTLLVSNKSSISCVCTPLDVFDKLEVGAVVSAKRMVRAEVAKPQEEKPVEVITEAAPPPQDEEEELKQRISGRVSAASYSHLSEESPSHRMRYAFTMRGNHIGNSRFSTECNITFRHSLGEWADVQDNLYNALKVYSLSVRYDFSKNSSLSLGRKINSRISSMGAIDGLQFELAFKKNFLVGAIAGARPNYQDYSFDPNLLQAGAYIGHVSANPNKFYQSTLAIVDQRNHFLTDRRFIYFQHSNSLVKNLNVFSSFEVDLFENINNEAKNTLSLTNLFVSLQYRVSKKLSLSSSYDTRKNVIYYESYKNYIDQLIEDETRQGMRVGFNLRPFKTITWGVNASWRFQKSGENDSKNLNSFLTFSRVPLLNISASLTANLLQTGYLNSKMFGLRISREIVKGKLSGDLYVRMVDYHYKNYEYTTSQYIGGVDFNLRITRNLGFYVFYEGALDDEKRIYHLFNTKVIQRF